MVRSNHLVAYDKDGIGFLRAPRATDAVGYALRSAYVGHARLPDDFGRLLRDLDRMESRPH